MLIGERYHQVLEKVHCAASRSGTNPERVKLVVITKTHSPQAIQAVVEAGALHIGESYVEEAITKIQMLTGVGIDWHMVGHVQSRKSTVVAENFNWLHSLDSVKLARRLSRTCLESGHKLNVFLECNVSGEDSKSGFPIWEDSQRDFLVAQAEEILQLPGIVTRGLMTIPPLLDTPDQARPYFRKLRILRDYMAGRFPGYDWNELSMGMSGDFETAIEEGATWVRVGTAIMGPRLS